MLLLPLAAVVPFASPAAAEFIQTGTILEAGPVFNGWGNAGTYSFTDVATPSGPAERDLQKLWMAIGTQNGGTALPSGSNPITYTYYRIDHGGTSASSVNWNMQLNLGAAGGGKVDHLLQFRATGTDAVSVRLSQYATPYPDAGAFTTGGFTLVASNLAGDGAAFKTGAFVRTGPWDGTRYGFEVAVPIAWFVDAPASAVRADGTGADFSTGTAFSSSGSFGAVGTVYDPLSDAFGGTIVITTNLRTGTSSSQPVAATQLAFGTQPVGTTSGSTMAPFTVQIRNALGVLVTGATHEVLLEFGNDPSGGTATLSGTTTKAAIAGVATFNDISINTVGTGYTLVATAAGLTSATSSSFDITSAVLPATKLGMFTQPSSTAASGTAFAQQPVVQLQDVNSGAVAQSGVSVTAAIQTDGGGTLSGTTTATTDSNGRATFTDLVITGTTGAYTLRFTSGVLTSVDSNTITLGAAPATKLAVTNQPSGSVANDIAFAQQPVIQLQDGSSNPVSQAGVTITAAIQTDAGGALGGTLTATTNAAGKATFSDLEIVGTAGSYTLRFTAAGLTSVDSGTIALGVGAASRLTVTTQPSSSATSGTAFAQQPVIQIQDSGGNAVSSSGVTVTAAIQTDAGGTLGGTAAAPTAAGGSATFTDLAITGTAGSYTLRFTATGLTSVDSTTITLGAGAAAKLAITTQPSSSATSGTAFAQQPVIQLQDVSGNVVSQSGVTITAAIQTDAGGALGGTATATTNAAGQATFTDLKVTGTAGSYTLRFTAGSLTLVDSGTITLGAGSATKLATTTQPSSSATSGAAFAQQPVIQLQDASSNAVSQSGVVVTAAIQTDAGGTLGGTTTATANAAGQATFTDLKITGTAGSYTLRFTATGLTSIDSDTITLGAGSAGKLAVTTQPSGAATGGSAFAQQPVIQLQDASGNAVSQSGVVITAAIQTDPGGTLGGTPTATTNAAGQATFTGLTITGAAGSYTLRFTASGLSSADSNGITIAAGSASKLAVTTQPSSSATSGTELAQQPVIQLRDASNNAVSQAGVIVTAAIQTDAGGSLGGTLTATSDSSGVVTFAGLKITGTAGSYTLRFTATGLTSIDSGTITLGAGSASKLAVTTQPSSSATSGTAFPQQPIIQVRDASNNAVSQAGITITAAIQTDAGGALGGTATATTDAAGQATFTDLKITGTAGSYTLRFAATGLTSIDSDTIALGAGAATKLVFTTQPSTSATSGAVFAQQPVVKLQDASDNPVSQAGVIVAIAIQTDAGGTLGGAAAATTDASGTATFSGLTITGAAGSYTLRITAPGLTAADSSTITLGAGAATALAIQTPPSGTANAGTVFAQQPVILIKDASGNTRTADATTQVTAAILTGSGTLLGTTTMTAVNGVVAFTDVKTNTAGTITIIFTSTGLTSVTSGSVVVSPTVPSTTATTVTAPGGTAGSVTTITITVKDALGNLVTGVGASLAASISGANSATPSITEVGNGVYTATYTPTNAGTDNVAITLSGTAVTGSPFTSAVSTGTASATTSTVTAPAGTAGSVTTITILAKDASGNALTTGGASFAIAITGANTATPTVSDNGDGTYTVAYTPTVAGTDFVAITLGGVALSGSPYGSTVGPGAAVSLAIDNGAQTRTAGDLATIAYTATVKDAHNNVVSVDSATGITWTRSSGSAGAFADNVFTPGTTAGSYTITATLVSNSAITNTAAFTITAGAINAITITNGALTQGYASTSSVTYTATAADAYGNAVTMNSATGITWTVSPTVGGTFANNVFTPGSTVGSYTVAAALLSDTSKTATAAFTLQQAPPPVVTSPTVSAPTSFLRGTGTHTIGLTGTGFQSGFTTTATGLNINIVAVRFISSTQIEVDVSATADATPGPRTLTITNPDGQSTTSRSIYIEALPTAVVDTSPLAPIAGSQVSFLNNSKSPDHRVAVVSWAWQFGDGASSTLRAPVHTYATPGTYTVSITVTDARGHTSSTTKDVVVSAPPTGLATRIVTDAYPRSPITQAATFSDLTVGGMPPYTYAWTVEGNTFGTATFTHTFNTLGSFPVTLTVTDAAGHTASASATVHVFRPKILTEPETVAAGATKKVDAPEGGVTLTPKTGKSPTAHIKVDIGNSPEAIDRSAALRVETAERQAARYMAVTVFDEHDILDFDRVRIEFTYTDADIVALRENSLSIHYWNGAAWIDTRLFVGGVIEGATDAADRNVYDFGHDTATNTIWAVLNRPSDYALVGVPIGGGGGGGGGLAPSLAGGFDRTGSLVVLGTPEGALLRWTATDPGIDGFQVWRHDLGAWTLLATVGGAETTYLDADADEGATYKLTAFTGEALHEGYVQEPRLLDWLVGWGPDIASRYLPFEEPSRSPVYEPPARQDPVAPEPPPVARPVAEPAPWRLDAGVVGLAVTLMLVAFLLWATTRTQAQRIRAWYGRLLYEVDGERAAVVALESRQLVQKITQYRAAVLQGAERPTVDHAAVLAAARRIHTLQSTLMREGGSDRFVRIMEKEAHVGRLAAALAAELPGRAASKETEIADDASDALSRAFVASRIFAHLSTQAAALRALDLEQGGLPGWIRRLRKEHVLRRLHGVQGALAAASTDCNAPTPDQRTLGFRDVLRLGAELEALRAAWTGRRRIGLFKPPRWLSGIAMRMFLSPPRHGGAVPVVSEPHDASRLSRTAHERG